MLTKIFVKEKTKYGPKSLYFCECGNKKVIYDHNVNHGKTRSCGCLQKKRVSAACKKHGRSSSRVHRIWLGMIGRCTVKSNKSYESYGAKGISVCDEWRDFECFLLDMGEPEEWQTLDRVDGNKGYSKENCRWATYQQQSFNTKNSRSNSTGRKGVSFNKSRGRYLARITFNGATKHLGWFRTFEEALAAREVAEAEVNQLLEMG